MASMSLELTNASNPFLIFITVLVNTNLLPTNSIVNAIWNRNQECRLLEFKTKIFFLLFWIVSVKKKLAEILIVMTYNDPICLKIECNEFFFPSPKKYTF